MEVSCFLALGAGVLSFFSPCILPLLPAYLSFITGVAVEDLLEGRWHRGALVAHVMLFCLGFSVVFVLMGATASTIAQAVYRFQRYIEWMGAAVVILFGLHLMGVLRMGWLQVERRMRLRRRPAHAFAAFVIGVAFAVGWSPCIGPILGGILAYASTRETLGQGVVLLIFYSMGLALPFLAAGLAAGLLLPFLKVANRAMRWIGIMSGLLLIIMGALLVTDNLQLFYRWIY